MTDRKDKDVSDPNEDHQRSSTSSAVDEPVEPPIDEVKLLRKVDRHVLPILFAVYVVAFLDRQVLQREHVPQSYRL